MKNRMTGCEHEPNVIEFVKSNSINEAIAGHLKICADCRETVRITRFLQNNLVSQSEPQNLPAAGLIWWKSELRKKQIAAERISKPLLIAQITAAIFAFAALVWLLVKRPPLISSLAAVCNQVLDSVGQILLPSIIGLVCFAFIFSIIAVVLRKLLLDK